MIKDILMKRDGMTEDQAEDEIFSAKELLQEYIDNGDITAASNICSECFGLEEDYIMELVE